MFSYLKNKLKFRYGHFPIDQRNRQCKKNVYLVIAIEIGECLCRLFQWRNSIGLWVGEPAGTRPTGAPKRRQRYFLFYSILLIHTITLYLGAPSNPPEILGAPLHITKTVYTAADK